MCSQFKNLIPIAKLMQLTESIIADDALLSDNWSHHVYPYAKAPVVTHHDNQNQLRWLQYSLVPAWSKVAKPKFSSYNARLDRINKNNQLEHIYNAPTWKIPFSRQHCIVPLSSFFESCTSGSHAGNIVRFTDANSESILLAAGIWDNWTDVSSGESITSFAILTDEPTQFLLEVGHDRQPVFLSPDNAQIWLKQSLSAPEAYQFLKQQQQEINYSVSNYRQLKGWKNNHDLFSGL